MFWTGSTILGEGAFLGCLPAKIFTHLKRVITDFCSPTCKSRQASKLSIRATSVGAFPKYCINSVEHLLHVRCVCMLQMLRVWGMVIPIMGNRLLGVFWTTPVIGPNTRNKAGFVARPKSRLIAASSSVPIPWHSVTINYRYLLLQKGQNNLCSSPSPCTWSQYFAV